ncbi:COQ9-domain-containing protein [Podospora fimiseda]|uniref:Ubiquinone biosynthesis protein n=1 Tax=Podospora fimiseda TaxID=252190 RepID=A0AAN7BRG9_9PEZI|nr:COQ9-domain-containing protein [Podospora fimiseda]
MAKPTPTIAITATRRIANSILRHPRSSTPSLLLSRARSTPSTPSTSTRLQQQQTPSSSSSSRPYHSTTHPPPPPPFTPSELSLLSSSYPHIPLHGFTPTSLLLGARDLSLLDISPSILPNGGEFSLIHYHLHLQRTLLSTKLDSLFHGTEAIMSTQEKVEALTWARLKANSQIISRWQEALAIMAIPSYAPQALKELALLSDEILFLAGDKSVDPTWYTKRASLATIYAAAELFMTTDKSAGFSETRAFLRRRLNEANTAGGFVGAVGQYLGFTGSAVVNILRSKGVVI